MTPHHPRESIWASIHLVRWFHAACPAILLALAACSAPVTPPDPAPESALEPTPKDCCLAAHAEAPALLDTLDRDVVQAFVRLSTTMVFEDAHIGYGGELSESVRAFRRIRSSPHARALFAKLCREATVVGQLYGAIGLRPLDPAAFEDVVEALRPSKSLDVMVRAGCEVDVVPLGSLLENDPSDPLMSHGMGPNDIVGGGFGARFERD